MKKRLLNLVPLGATIALSLALLLLAAGPAASDAGTGNGRAAAGSGSALVIGTTDAVLSLDPADAYDFGSWDILRNVGSGLLTYVPGTTELTPGLAAAMPEVSSDGTVYTFTLRSGLTFPDGEPLDAAAVAWSIDRVAALGGGPSWLVTSFVSDVQAVTDDTVRFTLKQPSAVFPHLVATVPYFPVSGDCFPSDEIDPDSTCGGLGPYTIASWTQGVSVTLQANGGYYGAKPRTPSIEVRYFTSAAMMRQALEDGEMDVAWKTMTPTDYAELEAHPDFDVVEGESPYIRHLCFNTTTDPFDDPKVRTALAAAVDRESIAHEVYGDTMSPLYSMVPQGIWSHEDTFRDRYGQRDLARARDLLRGAGFGEANKLELDLWYAFRHYGPQEPSLADALASDIEETGVVSVTVRGEGWPNYADKMGAGTLPVFLLGWYPDYVDPDNYLWPFGHSSSSDGLGVFYHSQQMDDLLEAGRSTTPVQGSARRAVYEDVQELWAEDIPTIPLLQGGLKAVTMNGIRGIRISPLNTLRFQTIWDARVSVVLEPDSAGSLTSDDGNTTLQFPAGAVTDTVVLTHTPLSDVSPGGSLSSIGNVFDLTAVYSDTGETAQVAPGYTYTVTAGYSETLLGPTIEDTLGLYWWDTGTGAWTQEGITSTVNTTDNLVTAAVDHFSRFAVLGETPRVYIPLVLRRR